MQGAGEIGERSGDCASCHPQEHAAWARSRHAHSADSIVFGRLADEAGRTWGQSARQQCFDCHQARAAELPEANVGCLTCHAAIGNHETADGRLMVDLDRPIAGPTGRANAVHAARRGGFLQSSSLCGTCHEVTGPRLFEEHTASEHRASGEPRSCADCHMKDGDHLFVGIDLPPTDVLPTDVLPTDVLPTDNEAQRTEAKARSEALLRDALALEVLPAETGVLVRVTNVGAGHRVPTGVAFLRDIWVDVTVTSSTGATETFGRVIALGDQPIAAGAPVALPTGADAIERHALAPHEHREVTITASALSEVEVVLRARAVRADAWRALGLTEDEWVNPMLSIHEARLRLE